MINMAALRPNAHLNIRKRSSSVPALEKEFQNLEVSSVFPLKVSKSCFMSIVVQANNNIGTP